MADDRQYKHRRRGPGRPFPPGVSGNPAGRPPGSRNRASIAAEMLLDGEAKALTRRAIQSALSGDVFALKLCLERILPVRRDRPINLAIPPITSAADLVAAASRILQSVASGEVTPTEAEIVMKALASARSIFETAAVEVRVKGLEEKTSGAT